MNIRNLLAAGLLSLVSCTSDNNYTQQNSTSSQNTNHTYNHEQEQNNTKDQQDGLQIIVNKADSYYEDNNWKEASNWYKTAIDFKEDDNDALFHYKRGFALAMLSNFDEALKEYNEGYKDMPHVRFTLFKNKKAGELYDKGMELDENIKSEREKAIKLFEESIKLEPRAALSYGALSHIYRRLGDNKKALETAILSGKYMPFSSSSIYCIPEALEKQKEYKEAFGFYKLALVVAEIKSAKQYYKKKIDGLTELIAQEK